MRLIINETEVEIPISLEQVTLKQRRDFEDQYGEYFTEMAKQIEEMPAGIEKETDTIEFFKDKAFKTFSFFAGCTPEALKEAGKDDIVFEVYYKVLANLFDEPVINEHTESFEWNGETWTLPPIELRNGSKMQFGELIDAKTTVKDKTELGFSKWHSLHDLAVIYLKKPGEQYTESMMYEGSERRLLMESLPVTIALQVEYFFVKHSEFLKEYFPIFFPSKIKHPGQYSKRHFEKWGWVNLLRSIAATKVFDIPGSTMNSIDCTRQTACFDVLVYASEEKELVEAQYLDSEEERRKHKH